MPDSSLPLPAKSPSALGRQLAVQRARRPADPLLSLVVPVFNEEDSIGLFLTLLFLFIRLLPMISIFELRALVHETEEVS